MAQALECPACGARHPLDRVTAGTFRCERCGQKLKLPTPTTPKDSPPTDGARRAAGDGAPVRPPPRRRPPGSAPPREGVGVSATLPARGVPPRDVAPTATATAVPAAVASGATAGAATKRASSPPDRHRVRPYWRLVAWVLAVPLGFVLSVWPAYKLGFLRKDDVLDVFVGEGISRYFRLAVVTLLWALVTAVLVQVFVEGGRWWASRRAARASRPSAGPGPARGSASASRRDNGVTSGGSAAEATPARQAPPRRSAQAGSERRPPTGS